MTTINAQAGGNWSATGTWAGGVVPVDGDVANALTFIVTFDVDINQPNTTLTATSGFFRHTASGVTRTVTAKADLGTHVTSGLIQNTGTGTLIFNGPIKAGNGSSAHGLNNGTSGTVIVNGLVTGGSGTNAYGAQNGGAGTLTVQSAIGGSGSGAYGVINSAGGTVNIGVATGGPGSGAHGVAISTVISPTYVDLVVGNTYGDGVVASNTSGAFNGISADCLRVKAIRYGSYGASPTVGRTYIVSSSPDNSLQMPLVGGGNLTISNDGSTLDFPVVSNVRAGVSYKNGDLTGTAAIPAAANVALGIPVDATTGTAVLTAAAAATVWDAPRASHVTAGSFGATAEWAGSVDEGAIADAVWDEATAGHAGAGSTGAALSAAGTAGDPWSTALPGAYGDGTAGQLLGDLDVSTLGGDMWTYPTRTLTAITVAGPGTQVDGGDITAYRGDSFSVTLTGLGNVTARTKLWFTAKRRTGQTDAQAEIQIIEGTGLTVIAGGSPTAGNGSLTVTNAATGAVTLALAAAETAKIPAGDMLHWDIQMATAAGVLTLAVGTLTFSADVTLATA